MAENLSATSEIPLDVEPNCLPVPTVNIRAGRNQVPCRYTAVRWPRTVLTRVVGDGGVGVSGTYKVMMSSEGRIIFLHIPWRFAINCTRRGKIAVQENVVDFFGR